MAQAVYKGFSSSVWQQNRSFALTNIELVKRDLLNHIYTLKGERVMMPDFGTRIPILAFEPNDEKTRLIVETDLRTVCEYDPRVRIVDLNVVGLPDNNAIVALVDLFYIEFNVRDVLRIEVQTK